MTSYRERLKAGQHDANNPDRDTSGDTTTDDLAGIVPTPKAAKAQVKQSTRTAKGKR